MPTSPNFGFLSIHDSQLVAANVGLYTSSDEKQIDLLRRLSDRGVLKGEADRLFHELRKLGNDATHGLAGNQRTALSGLNVCTSIRDLVSSGLLRRSHI